MKRIWSYMVCAVVSVGMALAEPLSVDSCLRLAAEHNADILTSRLEIEKAREVKAQVFTKFFPQVNAGFLAYHALNPLLEFGIADIQSEDARKVLQALYDLVKGETDVQNEISLMRHGLTVSGTAVQPLFMGGRIVNSYKLANLGVEAAELQAAVSERDVLESVESTYYLVVGLKAKQQTADTGLALLDSLQRTVMVARRAGLVTESDVLQIELKRNEMIASKMQLENGIVLASQLLALQIGVDSVEVEGEDGLEGLREVKRGEEGDILPPPAGTPPTLGGELGDERPEKRLLALRVEAEQLRKRIAIGEALPQIALGGTYYWGNPVKQEYNHNGLLFVTATVPLTQWWETSHKIREHNATIRQYELQQQHLTGQMELERKQALNTMMEAQALLRSDSAALKMAKENYRLAVINYRAGTNTLTDVLHANTLLLQAQNAITDRTITYITARRRLKDLGN
ncbi:MAG: TolC family protein [Paludibacteraceae bacterium]|nr:TolC family protein [Paludibacteraceae bacterium]